MHWTYLPQVCHKYSFSKVLQVVQSDSKSTFLNLTHFQWFEIKSAHILTWFYPNKDYDFCRFVSQNQDREALIIESVLTWSLSECIVIILTQSLFRSVLGRVCAVSLFIETAGVFLHTPAQFAAERWQSRTRSRRTPGTRHFSTAGERPAPHPDLPACRGQPAPNPLHRLLHLLPAQARSVWTQLHAAGTDTHVCVIPAAFPRHRVSLDTVFILFVPL